MLVCIQPSAHIIFFFTACPGRKFLGTPVSLFSSYWPVGRRAVAVFLKSRHRRNFPSSFFTYYFCTILSLALTGRRLVARRAEKSCTIRRRRGRPRLSPDLDSARLAVKSSQPVLPSYLRAASASVAADRGRVGRVIYVLVKVKKTPQPPRLRDGECRRNYSSS